jgi:hypothetical protein
VFLRQFRCFNKIIVAIIEVLVGDRILYHSISYLFFTVIGSSIFFNVKYYLGAVTNDAGKKIYGILEESDTFQTYQDACEYVVELTEQYP